MKIEPYVDCYITLWKFKLHITRLLLNFIASSWNGWRPNVNLKFDDLLVSSEDFQNLNISILSVGTCPLHIVPLELV